MIVMGYVLKVWGATKTTEGCFLRVSRVDGGCVVGAKVPEEFYWEVVNSPEFTEHFVVKDESGEKPGVEKGRRNPNPPKLRWTRENFDQNVPDCGCLNALECVQAGCGWLAENNRRLNGKLDELAAEGCSISR